MSGVGSTQVLELRAEGQKTKAKRSTGISSTPSAVLSSPKNNLEQAPVSSPDTDSVVGEYLIESCLVSPATKVIFVQQPHTNTSLCLKLWLPCKNPLYDTEDRTARIRYTIEGLHFNRQFAKDVYLGIAPVEVDEQKVHLGQLITNPRLCLLDQQKEYALVMKRLEESWHLSCLLHPIGLGTRRGMQFLACEVANMHRGLRTSPKERGNAVAVAQKWCLNKELFYLSLDKLMLSQEEREKYSRIGSIMEAACKNCAHYFEQRHRGGHIKRCHGDLKAANLWVRSASLTVRVEHNPKELLALDCVDFQPEFCHVDTLSDVAMLAVDIEMHLGRYTGKCGDGFSSWELTEHFLKTYLRAVGQQKRHKESHQTIWTLLEYYMTEKALICAFMNILYDELPGQGKRYLDVALSHARRLQRIVTNSRLPARCSKPGRSRNSLSRAQQVYHLRRRRVIPDRASQDVQVSNSRRSG